MFVKDSFKSIFIGNINETLRFPEIKNRCLIKSYEDFFLKIFKLSVYSGGNKSVPRSEHHKC